MLKLFFHYPAEILFIFSYNFRDTCSRGKRSPPSITSSSGISIDDESIALWSSSWSEVLFEHTCHYADVSEDVLLRVYRNRYREMIPFSSLHCFAKQGNGVFVEWETVR